MKRLSVFCLGLFLSAACGVESTLDRESFQTTQDIVGGDPAPDYPAVVAVRAFEPGADRGALCSATVIDPFVLLTAAHCLHPDITGENAEFFVQTSSDLADADNPSATMDVAEVHYHPGFNPSNPAGGNDIGVVIMAEPFEVTPFAVNRDRLQRSQEGDPAVIVGYGLNNGIFQGGAGLRRKATVKLNSFDDRVVRTGSFFGKNICSGDSGGPVFMNVGGVETVVGVHSYGTIGCFLEGSSTRVDQYLGFIDAYLD